MRLLKHIKRSIGLSLAVTIIVASLVIGLGISALQLAYAFTQQYQAANDLNEEILTLAQGGAANAAWTLDRGLAREVIRSVMAIPSVTSARIADENGLILTETARDSPATYGFVAWLPKGLIGDQIQGQRELSVNIYGTARKVGTLSVELAPSHVVDSLVPLAASTMVAGVVEALLIGLLLLWLSWHLVTTPLRRVAQTITQMDPEHPETMALPIPLNHEDNELGHLLRHANQLLNRLGSAQEQLRSLATRDSLTNLPNRTLIQEQLDNAILRAKRHDSFVAVLFLDLDRFKNINDSLGHKVGDELLVHAANKLTDTIRANDSVGRLGGDEFLIVMEDINNLEEVVRSVQRITRALSNTFSAERHEIRASGSIGIAVFPDDGENSDTLMRQADLAMYVAKSSGGGRWNFFAREMSERIEHQLRLETELSNAISRNELELHFQPKMDALAGSLAGCEALLRWRHGGELIAAERFISVVEETGIILEIGDWVLDQVCRRIKDWTLHYQPMTIALNVSARQLRDTDFVPRVLAAINQHGIDPRQLELEITETVLVDDLDRNHGLLAQLRDAGVALSIDDFGTGYSSLSYLTRLPIGSLKIDKSFVSGPNRSEAILNMVIAMAKSLELSTVAEGVETQYQQDWLISNGCDILQGHFISEPLDADIFEERFLNVRSAIASGSAGA